MTHKYVRTPGGILVLAPIVVPDQADLDMVFMKVAGGLFAWKHHRLIPRPRPFVVRVMSPEAFDFWSRELALPVQRMGSEVWWMSISDEEAKLGIWLFMLHDAAPVGVWVGRATEHPQVPPRHALAMRLP